VSNSSRSLGAPTGLLVAPVQIIPRKVAAIVAVDYAIWVEHRKNPKLKRLSQRLRLRGGLC